MYFFTAEIRAFWWAAIFYALFIAAHIKETRAIFWQWKIAAGFSSAGLIIGFVSGIIVFAGGVWVWKNAEELLLRGVFLCLGTFFLCSSIFHAFMLYGLDIYKAGSISFLAWLASWVLTSILINKARDD